jgi:hypothetical protein
VVTAGEVRALALAQPEATEHVTYGRPSFMVRRILFAWLPEDDVLVVKVDPDERDLMEESEPDVYVVSDHHRPYPLMAVRLARVDAQRVRELLEDAWWWAAPERLRQAREG